MKDQEKDIINLHIKDKKGKMKIEPIKISKQTKEILEQHNIYVEDVLNHVLYTDLLEHTLKHLKVTTELNAVEQKLLYYVVKDAVNNIGKVRSFETASLEKAINYVVTGYLETKDVDYLDASVITDSYLAFEREKYN